MRASTPWQEAREAAAGTGGMRTKLQAAELATTNGIDTIVTNAEKRPGSPV